MATKHAPTITTVDLVGEEDGSGSEEEEEDRDLVTLRPKATSIYFCSCRTLIIIHLLHSCFSPYIL